MPTSDDSATGSRIAERRKLARLTQKQLAARIPYSYSLLNQVECGARAASDDFVHAVAEVLGIDPSLLTEPARVTSAQADRLAAIMHPISAARWRVSRPSGD
ncbi:Helix-turn-helix domain-containing protein [Streptomyces sp. TverLS-915]|uniref:helix-turn-helix domain-containing protein n=1 Tax=Streptomyces sp. TverLS-915 TaxID=1839763 RepID=UPI00081EDE9F|nr:Helix-turn-helix domain-containing protein [Streptomyces sp. TverLS-915]